MNLPRRLRPQDTLTGPEVRHGLRMLLYDGVCTQVMLVLCGGAFLVAFALLLGASHKVIGLISAIGPFAQILQLPSVFLVERAGVRKALVVLSAGASRAFLVVMAVVPFVVPEGSRLPVFIASLFLFFGVGAIGGCAFNPWMRDFVPERFLGRYFAKRMAVAVFVGAVASLLAGVGIDLTKAHLKPEVGAYSGLFLLGAAVGFLGVFFLTRVPEPRMAPPPERSIRAVLAEPLRDRAFRRLLFFLGSWNFSVNLAAPFFAVYMLERLGLRMTWIMALFLVSQLSHVLFLRVWGRLADRFTNRSVLAAAGPMFMVSIVLWPFTMMPHAYALTVPLLITIHVLAGVSTAGVALCTGNIALKAAPEGSATAYLATNALISGLAATVAPLVAGFASDWSQAHGVRLAVGWPAAVHAHAFPSLDLRGLDLLFIASFVSGFYSLTRLALVEERGRIQEKIALPALFAETRRAVRSVSNVAGLRLLTGFSYDLLRLLPARKRPDRDEGGGA
jgi:MFS family permease